MNQGAQPILGFNSGSKQYKRVKKCYLLALMWCTIVLVISFAAIMIFPESLIHLFNSDPELTRIALGGIRTYLFAFPLIGIQMSTSHYF